MARMNLRIARIENRFTQKDLAEKVGVSQQTIAKWERGITTPSQFTQMRELEALLDCEIEALFPDVFSDVLLAE